MSSRIDRSWTVFVSVENSEHDRCVDIFRRADGAYASSGDALNTAERCVPWLIDVLAQKPELKTRIGLG